MNNKDLVKAWAEEDLYAKRLVVLIETDDEPDKYYQVIFNQKQYEKVSQAITEQFPVEKDETLRDGFEKVMMETSEEAYPLPEHLSNYKNE